MAILWLFLFLIGSIESRQIFTSVIDQPTSEAFGEASVGLSAAGSDEFRTNDEWRKDAIKKLWNERELMARTPLVTVTIPSMPSVDLIFKDETKARTGSLKHRYAWALVMWALLEGHINNSTTVFEASSGNSATSEGYMLQMLGVKYVVVVPETLEKIKEDRIRSFGAEIIKTYIGKRIERAEEEAKKRNGFFMNQFANADKAEEFHESGNFKYESVNVMHEIVSQLTNNYAIPNNIPQFFVAAAGTGGTVSSVGKFVKKYNLPTQVVIADTEFSIYYDLVLHGRFANESGAKYWVEPGMAGYGFGSMGPAIRGKTSSLLPSVIDRVIKIPDLASTASTFFLQDIGIHGGISTGTNFLASLSLAAKESSKIGTEKIKIATLLADSSHYYESSYLNRTWISANFQPHGGLPVLDCWRKVINDSYHFGGNDPLSIGTKQCAPVLFKNN